MFNASNTPLIGPSLDLVRNEILRVGAPVAEVQSAIALVGSGAAFDARAYDALTPRMRRLVDLVGIADGAFVSSICECGEASPADA